MGRARGSEEARGVLYKAHGRILPQKSHTAAGLCGEKMTEQEKSTTIFVPLSYHGGGAAVKRFCGSGTLQWVAKMLTFSKFLEYNGGENNFCLAIDERNAL